MRVTLWLALRQTDINAKPIEIHIPSHLPPDVRVSGNETVGITVIVSPI